MNFRNISSWCIRNPVAPIVLFVGLMLAGIIAFARMQVNNAPDIDIPVAFVSISQPGAAPNVVVGVVRPGYVIGDEVLRPAAVAVTESK